MSQMPRTRMIALAFCLALVTAVLVALYLNRVNRASTAIPLVTAKQNIASGAVVSAGMLTVSQFPRDKMPPSPATDPELVAGKVALTEIKAGDAISQTQLGEPNRMAYRVPPMMRAVTVALDPIIGVGGFIKPGDHVDVVATFEVNNGTVTKTVLQDVLLLATGAETIPREAQSESGRETKPQTVPNATLAVVPMDAEKLILAENRGKLRLTLRGAEDTSYISTRGITSRAVMGSVPPDVPEKGTASPAPARTTVVRNVSPTQGPLPWEFGQPLPGPGGQANTEPEIVTGKKIRIVRGTKIEETVVPE